MNEQDPDKKLRSLLDEVHRTDRAPPFRKTWDAAHRMRERRSLRWALVPALAAALLILWSVRPRSGPVPAPREIPRLEWNAPLDFLLQTPGSELLSTVPRFDIDRSLQ